MKTKSPPATNAKLTLLLHKSAIDQAKKFGAAHSLSVSKMVEFFFEKLDEEKARSLEEFPVADWVLELIQQIPTGTDPGPVTNKRIRKEFHDGKYGKYAGK